MSRVLNPEIGARAIGGELRDRWVCGKPSGRYPGGFAAGFEERALALFSLDPVLHVCSGGVQPPPDLARRFVREHQRVDVFHDIARPRPDGVRGVRPTVLADGRALPYKEGAFGAVLIDSPWSAKWTRDMYALQEDDYPLPDHLLREAARVVRPGGFVLMMHLVHPPAPAGTRRVARIEVVAGSDKKGQRLRRFTAYQKLLQADASTSMGQPDVGRTGRRRRRLRHAGAWGLAEFGIV